MSVIAPVSAPSEGYVVYEDTQPSGRGRRLDRTLAKLREAGIPALGNVVDNDPLTAVRDAIALDDPDELIVSTHPESKSGWRRRNLLEEIRKVAGDRPVEHVTSDVAARTGAENVLVVANETVVGEPLLQRIREKAKESERVELPDHLSAERSRAGRRTPRPSAGSGRHLRASGPKGSRRTGRSPIRIRSRRRCTRCATSASTRSSSRPSPSSAAPRGCGATWSRGCESEANVPVEHIVVQPEEVRGVSAHAGSVDSHGHGPPIANQSSRVSASVLGMFLFIASEAMLFGAFFTAYFFVRVVNPEAQPWPLEPFHLPVFVAGINTAILVTSSFTMHWALQSVKRGNRAGLQAGLVLTLLMGLAFLITQMLEYARIGFNPSRRRLRHDLLRADRPARGARLRRPDPARGGDGAGVPRSLHRRSTTTGSRSRESTGTSST